MVILRKVNDLSTDSKRSGSYYTNRLQLNAYENVYDPTIIELKVYNRILSHPSRNLTECQG